MAVHEVPFDSDRWSWSDARPTPAEHIGRPCVRLDTTTGVVAGVELVDGVVELDLAVGPERGFHGVTWRVRDGESFESFFVRPHQRGNPDAVQYTPVFNVGSIGWYDTVYLPLEAGENELVVAVSEELGGWGVQARFPDSAGLALD